MKKEFTIKGMTCNSCKERTENKLKEFVYSVHVDFSKEMLKALINKEIHGKKSIKLKLCKIHNINK